MRLINWFYLGMFVLFGNSMCLGYYLANTNVFNMIFASLGVVCSVLFLVAERKRN